MNKKRAYPTKLYIRFITFVILTLFVNWFKIKKQLPKEVKVLKEPFLLLSNHVGFWDPFIVGHFLPRFTHFVSSDAVFRSPLLRFFLTRLGTIPKKKNIRDTKVIRDIITVIGQGENVGVFPEAVRNWSGKSFPIDPSIAKLIKILNIPVVVGLLQGMNLFNPRWSKTVRRTHVNVDYNLMLTKDDINDLSENEIFERIKKALDHDEVAYQQLHMNPVYSNHKAEHISHALYVCPQCNAIDSFIAKGNNFVCEKCSYGLFINQYGFYELVSGDKLHFNNIRDWYEWQEKWMLNHLFDKISHNYEGVIFEDVNSRIYFGENDDAMTFLGEAIAKLYIDRIEICFIGRVKILVLNFEDLQTINPQLHERLEIFYDKKAYRLVGGRKGVSALKWEVAVNAIWQMGGEKNKLSPYIGSISQ